MRSTGDSPYRAFFAHAPCACLVTDLHAVIGEANEAAASLLRRSAALLQGRRLSALVHPADRRALGRKLSRLRAGHAVRPFPIRLQVGRGRPPRVLVQAHAASPSDCTRPALHWILVGARGASTTLSASVLGAASDVRNPGVVATLTHELRTPLSAVLGFVELALDGAQPGTQQHYLEMARSQGQALLSLINGVLDVSKLQARGLEPVLAPTELRALVGRVTESARVGARTKRIAVHCFVADDVPATVLADATRLEQVLANLLGNAVKFTAAGSVDLSVERADPSYAPAHGDALHFVVRDTGIGIPARLQRRIFEPFAQASSATARRYGGTGLGLSISKRLVEWMAGRMWLESAEGFGSSFHFVIPLKPQLSTTSRAVEPVKGDCHAREPAGAGPESEALRVLVAEDDAACQSLIRALLTRWGHEVVAVGDGAAVLDAFAHREFDLILMDLQMPGMDGLSAARAVRNAESPCSGPVPIVGLTAHAGSEEPARCRAAGMNGHLSKPVDRQALSRILRQVAAARNQTPCGPIAGIARDDRRKPCPNGHIDPC